VVQTSIIFCALVVLLWAGLMLRLRQRREQVVAIVVQPRQGRPRAFPSSSSSTASVKVSGTRISHDAKPALSELRAGLRCSPRPLLVSSMCEVGGARTTLTPLSFVIQLWQMHRGETRRTKHSHYYSVGNVSMSELVTSQAHLNPEACSLSSEKRLLARRESSACWM